MDLSIRIDQRQVKDFEEAMKKELPFATALALTRTAKQAQEEVRKELGRHFTLRNTFTANSIRFDSAKKKDWPNPKAVVGSVSPYLAIQEEGGEKTAGGKAFALPKGIRKSEAKQVPRSRWPGKILPEGNARIPQGGRTKGALNGKRSKPVPFLMNERGGVGVYVRVRRKDRALKRLYRLTRETMHVKPTNWLTEPVSRVVTANLPKNFEQALADAMRTRRA